MQLAKLNKLDLRLYLRQLSILPEQVRLLLEVVDLLGKEFRQLLRRFFSRLIAACLGKLRHRRHPDAQRLQVNIPNLLHQPRDIWGLKRRGQPLRQQPQKVIFAGKHRSDVLTDGAGQCGECVDARFDPRRHVSDRAGDAPQHVEQHINFGDHAANRKVYHVSEAKPVVLPGKVSRCHHGSDRRHSKGDGPYCHSHRGGDRSRQPPEGCGGDADDEPHPVGEPRNRD